MATAWKMIRVPVALAERLAEMALEMERAHSEGRAMLPNDYVERVPLRHVIDKAMCEMESHRIRSKAPKRRAGARVMTTNAD